MLWWWPFYQLTEQETRDLIVQWRGHGELIVGNSLLIAVCTDCAGTWSLLAGAPTLVSQVEVGQAMRLLEQSRLIQVITRPLDPARDLRAAALRGRGDAAAGGGVDDLGGPAAGHA